MSNNDNTLVFGSDQNKKDDQTRIETVAGSAAPSAADKTIIQEDTQTAQGTADAPKSSRNKAVIAGVGAAAAVGVSGVAYGAYASGPENLVADGLGTSQSENPLADASSSFELDAEKSASTTELHHARNTGHSEGAYEVNLLDNNNDGQLDTLTVNGQEVLPENIHYPENAGDMEDPCGSADFNDYVSEGAMMSDTMHYEIQPGDTLSEIAQANHTSVDHIMALNPQINNADLVYAGDGIVIPTNDNESNPYAEWNPESNAPTQVIEEVPPFECEPIEEGDVELDSSSSEYSEVEWSSFEDQPVEHYSEEELMQSTGEEYSMETSYENEFCQTDFNDYQTPDSYYSNDFDTDSYTTDFV